MENKTVRELRDIAKLKKIYKYYLLRKAELIAALTTAGDNANRDTVNLLDTPVPDLQAPVLTPLAYVASRQQSASILGQVKSDINSFANWLLDYIPETIKKPVNDKLEALKSKVRNIYNRIN